MRHRIFWLVPALCGVATIALACGAHDGGRARLEEAVALFEKVDYRGGRVLALCFLALVLVLISRSSSRARLEEGLALARELKEASFAEFAFACLGESVHEHLEPQVRQSRAEDASRERITPSRTWATAWSMSSAARSWAPWAHLISARVYSAYAWPTRLPILRHSVRHSSMSAKSARWW
jgi:hypothetical protein